MSGSSIADFYRDRNILITGSTGFMGKVLLEKLLRSCNSLKKLYLLIRPKNNASVQRRLEELLNSKVFDNIRRTTPEVLGKVHAIQGDIVLPGLGISEEDEQAIISDVSVVFHVAATIKFDEAIKLSLEMNVLGTKRMIELCHKMEKLVAFVHVSTAYCNCDQEYIQEIVYPPPLDPYKLMQLTEWMDDETFNFLTPKLIGSRPNTYTFTKALAEHILAVEAADLPVAIVRPSIVVAAWKEPFPGWVDNLNGPTGIFVGVGKGMLRTMHCDKSLIADFIPVDIPINLMIVSAWYTATYRAKGPRIFNCTSGIEKPLKWWEVQRYGLKGLTQTVMNDVVWYPNIYLVKTNSINSLMAVLLHWLPAYAFDIFARLVGKRPIMVKIIRRIERAASCLSFFTTHEWKFCCDNSRSLWQSLSDSDQQAFNFSLASLHWPTFMDQFCVGAKRFVMKEELVSVPTARKRLHKMWIIQQASRVLMVVIAWRLVMLRSEKARNVWYSLLRLLLRMITYLPILNRI